MAMALSPDEQKRLMVRPPTLTGSLARIAATRAMLWPWEPCGWPQPRITSSTSFLSSCGTLPSASVMQCAARSDGSVMLNDPRCDLASGVRLLATTTASLMALPFVAPRVERGASVPLVGLPRQQIRHRPEVAQLVIGLRNAGRQRHAAAIDPRDPDPERLGADHVGVLRLAAVQQPAGVRVAVREQEAEEGAVRLVAAGALGGADEVEAPAEIGLREQVVVDVRDDRQPDAPAQPIERFVDVGKPAKADKRVEVVVDEIGIAAHGKALERFLQRGAADLPVRLIRLPVTANVRRLPLLPELQHVDVRRTGLAQDRGEGLARPAAHIDERAVDVEGHEEGRHAAAHGLVRGAGAGSPFAGSISQSPGGRPSMKRIALVLAVLPLILARPAHADTMDFSWQSQAWTKTYDSPTQFTVSGPFTLSGQGSVTFAEIVTGGGAARTLSF